MIRHVEVHQIPERDTYHIYWRLRLPILLNKIKKACTEKYKYQQYIYPLKNCKNCILTCLSCILETGLCKEYQHIHVLEEATCDNVTS